MKIYQKNKELIQSFAFEGIVTGVNSLSLQQESLLARIFGRIVVKMANFTSNNNRDISWRVVARFPDPTPMDFSDGCISKMRSTLTDRRHWKISKPQLINTAAKHQIKKMSVCKFMAYHYQP